MRLVKRYICILLGALLLMSALSGCKEQETSEEGRFVLRAGVCGELSSLDPAMSDDPEAESVFCALYENLMRTEDDGDGHVSVVPGVAKEYQETVNYDGTVDYVFTLRSSARWSDGKRVKARDFAYAWRRLADPATGSPNHALVSMVQGYDAVRETGDTLQLAVKAEGDDKFRVTLSAPCAYFLSEVCTAAATMPLRSDTAREDPNWAASAAVPCDGPYRAGVWVKGEYIQLRRNERYYESRAVSPDILRFCFTESAQEAWQMYEVGELDYVSAPQKRADASTYLPLRATTCVLYNHTNETLANEHVRRALDLCLDRKAVAVSAGAGMTAATGLVPPGILDLSSGTEQDFRAAGGELCAVDDEGYSMRCLDAEGELRTGGYWGGVGFPSVSCLFELDDVEAHAAAASVVRQWKERLNLSVSLEGVGREELERRLAAGEYDLAIYTFTARSGDAMEFLAPFSGSEEEGNLTRYANTPFDLLLGVAATSRDLAARTAFLHDAESLLLDDAALSPLYFGAEAYLLREGLSGVRHDLRGNVYFTGVTRTEPAEAGKTG